MPNVPRYEDEVNASDVRIASDMVSAVNLSIRFNNRFGNTQTSLSADARATPADVASVSRDLPHAGERMQPARDPITRESVADPVRRCTQSGSPHRADGPSLGPAVILPGLCGDQHRRGKSKDA